MKKLVWVAGFILALSIVYPNGPTLPSFNTVEAEVEVGPTDETIVKLLSKADVADKARVVGIYSGLRTVLQRDAGKRVKTTEQWADLQANTLELAVEEVNKYPGLDVAINNVFLSAVGTDDVVPANADNRAKLLAACDKIINSAR